MKIRRILAASAAAAVMTTSLTACGDKADFYQMLNDISMIENGYESAIVTIDADTTGKMTLNVESSYLTDGTTELSIGGTMHINAGETPMDFVVSQPLQILMSGDTIYIAVDPLIALVKDVASIGGADAAQVGAIVGALEGVITADYLKIDEAGINSALTMTGASLPTDGAEGTTTPEIDADKAMELSLKYVQAVVDAFEKNFKSIEPALVTAEDGVYTFKITEENYGAFCGGLVTFIQNDLVPMMETLKTDMTPVLGEEAMADFPIPTTEEIQEMVTSINQSATDINENIKDLEFSCSLAKGKPANENYDSLYDMDGKFHVVPVEVTEGEMQFMTITFDSAVGALSSKGIEAQKAEVTAAAASCVTVDEAMNALMTSFGGGASMDTDDMYALEGMY